MYKLIASDLDETLLTDNKKISKKNLEALYKAKEKGIRFVPATGRGFATIQDTLKELHLYDLENEYSITFNGGIVTENKDNKILHYNGLPFETVSQIFEFGLQKDVCIHVYTKTKVYIYNGNEAERNYLDGRMTGCVEATQPTISFLQDTPLVKILFQNTDIAYLETIQEEFLNICSIPLSISYSANRYLEFNQDGVDKGTAAINLASSLGIKPEEIIGIGDNSNDIALIEKAGLGISVKNGTNALKEKADYITRATNNDDAVAEVIERFIL